MPQSITPLDKKKHAALTFKALEDYSFTKNMLSMPLLAFEVAEAANCFPIVFAPGSAATPHALLGLGEKNIFVDAKGRWLASYIPLVAANYPFSLISAPTPEQPAPPADTQETPPSEVFLAIEEDAPHFHKKDGQPLYTPEGEATELLHRISSAMGNQHQRFKESKKALAELALSGVLAERSITVHSGGAARMVSGLRVADREKVMALPDPTLARWTKNGVLEILFAHWRSMHKLQNLLEDPSCPAADSSKDGGADTTPPVQ